MKFVEAGGLKYAIFNSFAEANVPHGFFTRIGGVSPVPWDTLNLASTVGDTRESIIENRHRIFKVFNREVESIFDVWQVHSDTIIDSDKPRPLTADHKKADAIITSNPDVTLFMRFADCVPVMLFDPDVRVISIVHAGWKGTINKILTKTVLHLQTHYGAKSIMAGIGPAIGPCHYQVGTDVLQLTKSAFPDCYEELIINGDHLDLWKANAVQLYSCGVSNVEISKICTACDTSNWFSHRAEKGKTGRFGAILHLPAE